MALRALVLALESNPALVPADGRIAFLRAQPHPSLLGWGARLVCQQDFKPVAAELEAAGCHLADAPEGKFSLVMLLPDRQKLQTLADLARGMDLLEDGGTLVVSLHNDWGARRFENLLAELAGEVGSISKGHCRVFWASKTQSVDQELLTEWRSHGETRQIVEGRFWSQPGLFSWDEVDGGSQLLTEHLPEGIRGAVADFGCGWGFLSDFLLRKYPAIRSLHVFEADRAALECAKMNLSAAPAGGKVHYHWDDVRAGIGTLKFDFVIMNAPFHEGRRADPTLGLRFIEVAAGCLRPGGELWLVANRQLPYEKHLQAAFEESAIVIQTDTFKVICGVRPARNPERTHMREDYNLG